MRFRPALAAAFVLALPAAPALAADPAGWSEPPCRDIQGAPSVTATVDDGARLARTAGRMDPVSYSFGLVPLDRANTMLATVGAKVIRSTDAGCTWLPWIDLTQPSQHALLTLSAAPGGGAYAWALNDTRLFPIHGRQWAKLRVPGAAIMGLAVDAADPRHLRYGDANGVIWDSRDGGRRWAQTGALKGVGVYRVAFDAQNLDHVVIGALAEGSHASFDGGATWQRASGYSAAGGPVNVFNLVVSPADGRVVWAMGLDIDASGTPSGGRHIYRSVDGGLSFAPVVDQGDGVTLINGPLMAAHPTDPALLYFVFGMSFGGYGTDLFRYDAAGGGLTRTHNAYDEVSAIAFHPRDPKLMYLGLASEDSF